VAERDSEPQVSDQPQEEAQRGGNGRMESGGAGDVSGAGRTENEKNRRLAGHPDQPRPHEGKQRKVVAEARLEVLGEPGVGFAKRAVHAGRDAIRAVEHRPAEACLGNGSEEIPIIDDGGPHVLLTADGLVGATTEEHVGADGRRKRRQTGPTEEHDGEERV